mgnify:CR=1 FL=1
MASISHPLFVTIPIENKQIVDILLFKYLRQTNKQTKKYILPCRLKSTLLIGRAVVGALLAPIHKQYNIFSV